MRYNVRMSFHKQNAKPLVMNVSEEEMTFYIYLRFLRANDQINDFQQITGEFLMAEKGYMHVC